MASQQLSAIEEMVAAASSKVGSSNDSATTTSSDGSSATAGESSGVTIQRQSHDHIKGQAESGGTVDIEPSPIMGKKINIEDSQYKVTGHFIDTELDVETLILKRPIEFCEDEDEDDLAEYTSKMGYDNLDDLDYSESEKEFAGIQIKEKMEAEECFEIIMPDENGKIGVIDILIDGINYEDSDYFDIVIHFEETEKTITKIMSRRFITDMYLLFNEWVGNFTPDSKEAEDEEETVEDILGNIIGSIVNKGPHNMKELFEDIDKKAEKRSSKSRADRDLADLKKEMLTKADNPIVGDLLDQMFGNFDKIIKAAIREERR